MNKLMTTLAAIALSFGAFASITTIPLNPGSNPAPFTAKIVATAPVTNITVKQSAKWTVTPYTNALYSGTLSSGYLSEAVSNKFLLGGTDLVVDGTAFTGGNAYLILER